MFDSELTNDEKRLQLRQDFAFIKLLLQTQQQTMVLRWRKGGQPPFRTAKDMAGLEEDLLQHTSGMLVLLSLLVLKAEAEGSDEFDDIHWPSLIAKIQFHDAEEILTGDVRIKKRSHTARAQNAWQFIMNLIKDLNFAPALQRSHEEYEAKKGKDDRLVKALDEIQAWAYLIFTRKVNESTRVFTSEEVCVGFTYTKEFPTLHRVAKILLRFMKNPNLLNSRVETLSVRF